MEYKKDILNLLNDLKSLGLSRREVEERLSYKTHYIADLARDMFLFSFYTHGMRFQNVATMPPVHGSVIQYRMNKGKKIREISIHPKLKGIIDKYNGKPYLFPLLKSEPLNQWELKEMTDKANALINLYLKRVAVICGIEKRLTFHIARHTFAYLSLDNGVSYEILKDALGHSSYSTTQMYLKSLSDRKINEAVKALYE